MQKIKLITFVLFFSLLTKSSFAILEVTKLPYKDAEIEKIYILDNGKFICNCSIL